MRLDIEYTKNDAKKILFLLFALEVFMFIAYLSIYYFDLHGGAFENLFDLDSEVSIPTWFSTIQLFFAATILLLLHKRIRKKSKFSTVTLITGILFIFLSADEGASIHENVTVMAKSFDLHWMLLNQKHGAWILLYTLIGIPLFAFYIKYFVLLWRSYKSVFNIGALGSIVFVIGALFLEMSSYYFLRSESTTKLYRIEVALEEFMEMAGISIILYAILLFSMLLPFSHTKSENSQKSIGQSFEA